MTRDNKKRRESRILSLREKKIYRAGYTPLARKIFFCVPGKGEMNEEDHNSEPSRTLQCGEWLKGLGTPRQKRRLTAVSLGWFFLYPTEYILNLSGDAQNP